MSVRALILGLFSLGLVACDVNADKAPAFVEGDHYEVVAETATATPEVKEFFSFYCGHCLNFEPLANKLAKQLPKGVELEKVHVDFVSATPPDVQNAMARAYLVGKEAGQGEQIAALIFSYIHRQQANFSSESDIRSLLLVNDFDAAVFDSKFNSMPVLTAAQKMKEAQTFWSEKKVLTGVPMLLVNGKYKVKFDKLNPDNFEAEASQLLAFLLQKKD